MTLRPIESEFSEYLQKEAKEEFPLDLTLDGPILSRTHPHVLMARLLYLHNPEQETEVTEVYGWFFDCFESLDDASAKYPGIQLKFTGRPWSINKFLQGNAEKAIVDFAELGAVVLSKSELKTGKRNKLYHHILTAWLTYALSPELWGPVGKWTRFHSRLHELFSSHDLLLSGEDTIGYYPLKSKAAKLHDSGFMGTNLDKSYLLVLPWTFSLTALNKLEEIVKQEF
jgi:hypothetical protein